MINFFLLIVHLLFVTTLFAQKNSSNKEDTCIIVKGFRAQLLEHRKRAKAPDTLMNKLENIPYPFTKDSIVRNSVVFAKVIYKKSWYDSLIVVDIGADEDSYFANHVLLYLRKNLTIDDYKTLFSYTFEKCHECTVIIPIYFTTDRDLLNYSGNLGEGRIFSMYQTVGPVKFYFPIVCSYRITPHY